MTFMCIVLYCSMLDTLPVPNAGTWQRWPRDSRQKHGLTCGGVYYIKSAASASLS